MRIIVVRTKEILVQWWRHRRTPVARRWPTPDFRFLFAASSRQFYRRRAVPCRYPPRHRKYRWISAILACLFLHRRHGGLLLACRLPTIPPRHPLASTLVSSFLPRDALYMHAIALCRVRPSVSVTSRSLISEMAERIELVLACELLPILHCVIRQIWYP